MGLIAHVSVGATCTGSCPRHEHHGLCAGAVPSAGSEPSAAGASCTRAVAQGSPAPGAHCNRVSKLQTWREACWLHVLCLPAVLSADAAHLAPSSDESCNGVASSMTAGAHHHALLAGRAAASCKACGPGGQGVTTWRSTWEPQKLLGMPQATAHRLAAA